MAKPLDTRNWRCFFGMHQWDVVTKVTQEYYAQECDKYPCVIRDAYTMRCVHCGEMTKRKF